MIQTTTLGGAASNVTVGKVAHGLMLMTWKPNVTPDEQAFEAIRAGVDTLPQGVSMVLNSGEFYGNNLSTANLELLARFFERYPEYNEKTFLSVKGGLGRQSMTPDASAENLRLSVDAINAALRGTKRLDLFQCARVDPRVPIEEQIETLSGLIKEGKFDHIGLSECSAETLRRANAVHPITAAEIEVSAWSYEDETRKVIATAKELNISVVAYSPLGRGLLAGKIQRKDDLDEGDNRRRMSRFQDENIQHNITFAQALQAIAEQKGITPAQLSIAWVSSLGDHVIPLPGSSHVSRTLENLGSSNVDLSAEDLQAISKAMSEHEIKGDRYFGLPPKQAHLWG